MTFRACPICGAPAEPRYRPFCSARCADVDLHRWLTGGYALEADEEAKGPPGSAYEGEADEA